MMRRPLLLLLVATLLATFVEEPAGPDGYRSITAVRDTAAGAAGAATPPAASAITSALVSLAGLPPVSGTLVQSGGSLVFRPADDGAMAVFPLFRTYGPTGSPRHPSVSLLEVASGADEPIFLFHLGAAVVETSAPGILGELVAEPARIEELGTPWTTGTLTLAAPGDLPAAFRIVAELGQSPYADSLFALFGRPDRAIGVVSARGERAGRLGEYMAGRDSVALSPSYITSAAQLRHSLAHELAHRWLRDHPQSAEALTAVMAPIRDPLRYGFRDHDEQLAESLAFAVHFLDASRRRGRPSGPALLESYERLVPGTRNAASLLLTFPAYERHPLARAAGAERAQLHAADH